jgi:hypothetical protein
MMYEITALPALTPVTTPENIFTDALAELLDQVPPASASVNVIVEPTQTADGPDTADGSALTVATDVTTQPLGSV